MKVREGSRDPLLVKWHARDGETPGWDITSVDEAGEPIFIEVKASVGESVSELLLTANEWIAAGRHGARYHLYVVTDAMKSRPTIEIISNPSELVETGQLEISTAAWCLELASSLTALSPPVCAVPGD